jgi:integrase
MRRRARVPSYRLHRPSGQAVVTLGGRDRYLGPHGSEESRAEYDRLLLEWLPTRGKLEPAPAEVPSLTVAELLLSYWEFADGYYRKDGEPTSEWHLMRTALRSVRRLYGHTPAAAFGPKSLKACREELIGRGLRRQTVNHYAGRIKRMFRWAVANELLPASVHQALQAVDGLRRGRCAAPDGPGVGPVPEEHVEAVLPLLPRPVAAMVRLQLLTGMRPGEVAGMRVEDLDRSGPVWEYRPPEHKTAHRGHERSVPIGPQGQAVLWPFLQVVASGTLFSPARAEEERNAQRRTTGRWERRRAAVRRRPPGERYDVASYRRAIARACEKASVPAWKPHQLRHTAATRLRKQFGIEAARVILGHRSSAVTEIYAEVDRSYAVKVMAEVG